MFAAYLLMYEKYFPSFSQKGEYVSFLNCIFSASVDKENMLKLLI